MTAASNGAAVAKVDEYPADRLDLLKRTICQGATNDEFQLFVGQCRRTGLDPFARQIHAVKRWDAKQQREVMSIQVGIDGFRLIAERTGETDGQEGPLWCGEDGKWVDVWLSAKPPCAAKIIVYRKGRQHPYTGVAHWNEYKQTKKDGTLTGLWAKMPALMLAKTAEALALRKAFPQELSGLYAPEEMDQAGEVEHHAAEPHHDPEPPKALSDPRQPVAAVPPVPLTLDDIRAKFRGMKIDGHLTLCKAVNRLDDVLPSVAAGYDRGTIWEWLNQEMGWSESADLGLVLPADIEAAAAKVGEYLTLLKPAA